MTRLRMITGKITSSVASERAPLKANLRRRLALTTRSNAIAHAPNRSSGFTRSQPARPSNAPAATANRIRCRFAANNRHHTAPNTSQLAGASAFGVAPESASNGDNAAIAPAKRPTPSPYAVAPMPTTSSTESESIINCTLWTEAGDRSAVIA